MKNIALLVLLLSMSLSAMGQSDQFINSSINAFVPANETSFLGFIIAPRDSNNDVDVVILAEGEGDFDPVVSVFFDSTPPPGGDLGERGEVALNDDWGGTTSSSLRDFEFDFPNNSTTASARNCWENQFSGRLRSVDSLVLVSATAPSGTRAIFAEVRDFGGNAGKVNLQLLQVDGLLANICPDF